MVEAKARRRAWFERVDRRLVAQGVPTDADRRTIWCAVVEHEQGFTERFDELDRVVEWALDHGANELWAWSRITQAYERM